MLSLQPAPADAASAASASPPAAPTPGVGGSAASKESEVLEKLRAAVRRGVELQLLQRVPHLVLLSEAYYQAEIRPLLADWMVPWLRRHGVRDITDEQMLVAIHTPSAVSAAVQQVLGDRHIKMLNLAADWLGHLLPHVLRKVT